MGTIAAWNSSELGELRKMLSLTAKQRISDPSVVEDLVQETLLAAFEARDRFEGRSSLRTWLVSILLRKVADHHRRRGRELGVFSRNVVVDADTVAAIDPWQAPDEALASLETYEIVEKAVESLRPLERAALVECAFVADDYETATSHLGVQSGHLRVLLYRGRQKVRGEIECANKVRALRPRAAAPVLASVA